MTQLEAANNVEPAPQVEDQIEETATPETETTQTLEADATSEGDSFIPEDNLSEKVQKRINRLTWERHEAERIAAVEISSLKEQLAVAQTATPQAAEQPPTLKQFDYDDDKYQSAMIDYKVGQRLKEYSPAPAPQGVAPDPQVASFLQKQGNYSKENVEYTQMVRDPLYANAIPQGSAMESYILSAENGPKLHHHLLNNTPELIRIQSLPEWAQGAELAKIEAKTNQVKQKAKSNAPDPVKPVSNGKQPAPARRKSSIFPY